MSKVISTNSIILLNQSRHGNIIDEQSVKKEEQVLLNKMKNILLITFVLNCIKILESLILGIVYAIILSFSDTPNDELNAFVIISCVINFIAFTYGLWYTILNFPKIINQINEIKTDTNNETEKNSNNNSNLHMYANIALIVWSAHLLSRLNNQQVNNYMYTVVFIELVNNSIWFCAGLIILCSSCCVLSKSIKRIYDKENMIHNDKNIDNV
jgi:hypothetical protein